MRSSHVPNRPLDVLAFAIAGLRDGVGPLLTLFLVQRTGWSPQELSWVLAVPGLAGLFLQVPVGLLYDRVKSKQYLVALGAALLALASVGISRAPGLPAMFALQFVVGVAMNLLSVGIPAIALGTAGAAELGQRIARNEVFSKIGNFTVLGITGFLTQRYSLQWMFVVVAVASLLVIASSLCVRPAAAGPRPERGDLREVLRCPRFLTLLAVSFLYMFANGSMFMIFEQVYTRGRANAAAGTVSALLFLTQSVITVGTIVLARRANDTLVAFTGGFVLIALRGLALATPFGLVTPVAAQVLDGLIASIILIVPMRAVAELSPVGFNLRQGVMGTACSLAYSLSTIVAGYLIAHLGHRGAFLVFAGVGAFGAGVAFTVLRESARIPRHTLGELAVPVAVPAR